jgi:hypothetical protein
MNHGSPLSKDQRQKKTDPKEEKFAKEKFKISVATTKKILKERIVGHSQMVWLNQYMDNKIRGECLPLSFLSNDLPSELARSYGEEGAEKFKESVRAAYLATCPKTNP